MDNELNRKQQVQEKIQAECTKYLYIYSPRIIPFNIFIMTVVVVFLWTTIPTLQLVLVWLVLAAICWIRYSDVKKQLARGQWLEHSYQLIRQFCLWASLTGVIWGLSFLLFANQLPVTREFFLLFILGGMAAGAIVPMATVKSAYISFITPMLLAPLSYYLFLGTNMGAALAAVIILFTLGLYISYHRSYLIVTENITLRFDKDDLITALSDANKRIKALAQVDDLTKLPNRRALFEYLLREIRRGWRSNTPLSIALIDIDQFRTYNEHYRHMIGDRCLQQVAHVLSDVVKHEGDFVARFGGEKFIVVLPNTEEAGVKKMAARIHDKLTEEDIKHEYSNIAPYLTVSIGIYTMVPHQRISVKAMIKAAEQALFLAKKRGYNQTVSYEQLSELGPEQSDQANLRI